MAVGLVVAYEPVWAISKGDGRGQSARPQDIEAALKKLRENVEELYGQPVASQVRFIYGGSSNPHNVKDYLKIKNIDGFLVGGASLNYQQFAEMILAVKG